MNIDRVVEQFGEAVLEIPGAVIEIDLVADVPIAPDSHLAILDGQCMARQQLFDAAEQRLVADRVLKGQILGQRLRIGGDLRQERQQRLRFRGKDEEIADDRVIERLDAEAITGAKQPLVAFVP